MQAGQYLNVLLANLAQSYDLDIIRETTTLNLNPGTAEYELPDDFLRTREVFYSIQGTIFWCTPYAQGLADYDQQFKGSGINNYPYKYATNVSLAPTTMLFYPPPQIAIPVTVRYQPQPTDIVTPETSATIPWFPNQLYLIKQLSAELMADAVDPRAETTANSAKAILRDYTAMSDDKEGRARNVPLDPNRFRSVVGALKLTKNQPLP